MDPMKMTALETQLLDIMRANAVGDMRSPCKYKKTSGYGFAFISVMEGIKSPGALSL